MREAFVDEVEIRLFESDLETNLQSLQRQLMAYAEDVARHDDYVAYKVPKMLRKRAHEVFQDLKKRYCQLRLSNGWARLILRLD